MAAEWLLQPYAYDPKRLAAFVGSGDEKLARAIARAAKELHDDDRLDAPLEEIVLEIARGELVRAHARSYRIALEAVMNRVGDRAARISTYALKPDVGRVLGLLGQKALALAWKRPSIAFPTPALARAVDWPMATSLDAPAVARAAKEWAAAPKRRAELDARVLAHMKNEPDFATDVADVIETLGRVVKKTKGALMILVDGEQ